LSALYLYGYLTCLYVLSVILLIKLGTFLLLLFIIIIILLIENLPDWLRSRETGDRALCTNRRVTYCRRFGAGFKNRNRPPSTMCCLTVSIYSMALSEPSCQILFLLLRIAIIAMVSSASPCIDTVTITILVVTANTIVLTLAKNGYRYLPLKCSFRPYRRDSEENALRGKLSPSVGYLTDDCLNWTSCMRLKKMRKLLLFRLGAIS